MIKSLALFLFLLLLGGCASDRQLSDDICFTHQSVSYEASLKIRKDKTFYLEELYQPIDNQMGTSSQSIGDWQFAENSEIILAFRRGISTTAFFYLPNSKDLQKIDNSTLRLNTLADSLQLADGIWLYRTTCELKGVKMRRGTIDSSGVFRRDK